MMKSSLLAMLLLALAIFLSPGGPVIEDAAAAECIPWSEARPIIADRSLIGSERAAELAQARFSGELLVNVKFCREGGEFVYLVFLLHSDTQALRRVVVDAVTGEL